MLICFPVTAPVVGTAPTWMPTETDLVFFAQMQN